MRCDAMRWTAEAAALTEEQLRASRCQPKIGKISATNQRSSRSRLLARISDQNYAYAVDQCD